MSSESEDDLEKFREAVDTEIVVNYKKTNSLEAEKLKNLPSLRSRFQESYNDSSNFVKTTPKFREYVSKCLDNALESQIKYKNKNSIKRKKEMDNNNKGGIKLFKSSPDFINLTPEDIPNYKRNTKRTNKNVNNLEGVAITVDQIKKEVEHWSKRTKAPVYKYIQTKNGFVLKENEFVS